MGVDFICFYIIYMTVCFNLSVSVFIVFQQCCNFAILLRKSPQILVQFVLCMLSYAWDSTVPLVRNFLFYCVSIRVKGTVISRPLLSMCLQLADNRDFPFLEFSLFN